MACFPKCIGASQEIQITPQDDPSIRNHPNPIRIRHTLTLSSVEAFYKYSTGRMPGQRLPEM